MDVLILGLLYFRRKAKEEGNFFSSHGASASSHVDGDARRQSSASSASLSVRLGANKAP